MPEDQNIEWKESWNDKYLEWICGFANAQGGIIYIGKNDDGETVGIGNSKKLMEMIPNKVRDTMGVIVDVDLEDECKLEYLKITVNLYPFPISLRGKYYYRSGSTMLEMTGAALDRFMLQKQGKTWDGELMLAVLSSFAQEESRSMSENNKWTIKKKFERGEVIINVKRFMGYDLDETGDLAINREEAKIVRRIFDMYLSGKGTFVIARELNEGNTPTITGALWHDSTIIGMLKNEKYKGDVQLQKYFTPENKRNQTVPNRGQVDSFYITDNHPAIVSKEQWDKVQEIMIGNIKGENIDLENTKKYQNRYPLSGMLICGKCGKALKRRYVYGKKVQWICSTYIQKGKSACSGIRIDDSEVCKLNIIEPTVVGGDY